MTKPSSWIRRRARPVRARMRWLAVACSMFGLLALTGRAQAASRCFELSAAPGAGSTSSARAVTLATAFKQNPRCEYGLAPEGPWVSAGKLGAHVDFASLALALQEVSAGAEQAAAPVSLFARSAARAGAPTAALESVFLAGGCKYLLNGVRGLSLTVAQATQHPTFERTPDTDACGARALEFAFVELPDSHSEAPPPLLASPFGSVLAQSATRTALEAGSYAVYALGPSGVGYLIGEVRSGSSLTPLRAALRELTQTPPSAASPWLRATWSSGELRLEPITQALRSGPVWTELRAAASSGALWLTRPQAGKRLEQGLLGKLLVDAGGDTLALPSEHIAQRLKERYGAAGAHMVPTFGDWRAVLKEVALCLNARYDLSAEVIGSSEPTCAALTSLVAPLAVHGGGTALPAGQVCIKHYVYDMSSEGVRQAEPISDSCIELPSGNAADPRLMLAAAGDALILGVADTRGLFVCTDNHCEAAPATGSPLTLKRSGIVELRVAADATQALSLQGLCMLRLGVVDPATDWQPLGLYHAAQPPSAPRWQGLDHDEPSVFTFVPGQDTLDSWLSLSPVLEGAWNAQTEAPAMLQRALPRVRALRGSWGAPKPAALVVLPTRNPSCPDKPASQLTNEDLVTPEGLLVDQDFYLQLALYEGESTTYRCIARAHLRVTEHWTAPASSRLRAGLIGDVQALMFVTDPPALGFAVPLAYARYRLGAGLGLEAAGSLTAATAIDHGQLSRAGVGLSMSAYFGPEAFAPRLLSLGVMLHAASGSHRDKPIASVLLGLNMSTLFGLTGNR